MRLGRQSGYTSGHFRKAGSWRRAEAAESGDAVVEGAPLPRRVERRQGPRECAARAGEGGGRR